MMHSSACMSPLAAVHYERGDDIDQFLVTACKRLAASGVRLGGLLQVSRGERGGNCAASVHVVDLRTGRTFDIWQDRGACARGCRLDEGGLAQSEIAIRQAIADRVDLLVINRFGRAESLGRGLRECFEAALLAGIPALTAVRPPYDVAWAAFHGGLATDLTCNFAEVLTWASRLHAGSARELRRNDIQRSFDGFPTTRRPSASIRSVPSSL
ncbi:MAG: hypothetical protein DIU65_15000 [Proteobacteria bacterium]|nr:MAG: hypothetical protein DIU65_15000 [Pseudomonadota bacterium]